MSRGCWVAQCRPTAAGRGDTPESTGPAGDGLRVASPRRTCITVILHTQSASPPAPRRPHPCHEWYALSLAQGPRLQRGKESTPPPCWPRCQEPLLSSSSLDTSQAGPTRSPPSVPGVNIFHPPTTTTPHPPPHQSELALISLPQLVAF